jgi:rRNA maturation endonuclease Nob1
MFPEFPMAMLIRCYGCGKVFDVLIPGMEPHDCPCPGCGRIEVVDLGSVQRKAIAWQSKMIRKQGGGDSPGAK